MKTHVIITYTKSHYLITDEQNEILKGLRLDDEINIEGSDVKIRNIAEVMTIQKYYETYPDKRPSYVDKYKYIDGMGMTKIISTSREKALRGIKKGLEKYINSDKHQGGGEPLELIKMCDKRLLEITN